MICTSKTGRFVFPVISLRLDGLEVPGQATARTAAHTAEQETIGAADLLQGFAPEAPSFQGICFIICNQEER